MAPNRTGDGPPHTILTVEHEPTPTNVNPMGNPRFSWRVPTTRRGAAQTAYRLVVERDADAVVDGRGDCWDSGWVDSDRATDVAYDGPGLAADETYYWSVSVETAEGRSSWAEPATFATALTPEDWHGEWIAHQPGVGDTNGWRSQWQAPDTDDDPWVQVDLGESQPLDTVDLHLTDPVTVVRTPDDYAVTTSWSGDPLAGFGFPRGLPGRSRRRPRLLRRDCRRDGR